MSRCIEFLTELGFEEDICDGLYLEDISDDDIETYDTIFKKNI